jgi:hypothetical protein
VPARRCPTSASHDTSTSERVPHHFRRKDQASRYGKGGATSDIRTGGRSKERTIETDGIRQWHGQAGRSQVSPGSRLDLDWLLSFLRQVWPLEAGTPDRSIFPGVFLVNDNCLSRIRSRLSPRVLRLRRMRAAVWSTFGTPDGGAEECESPIISTSCVRSVTGSRMMCTTTRSRSHQ